MKVSYRTAIVSLCLGLTKADAKSVPVAALLVGSVEDQYFAAARAVDVRVLPIDPLASAILGDVIGLIKVQMDETVQAENEEHRDPERLLFLLQNSLRNSLHVSSVSERAELELDLKDRSVEHWALDKVEDLLDLVVRESGMLVVHEGGRKSAPPAPKRVGIRPTQLWPLQAAN